MQLFPNALIILLLMSLTLTARPDERNEPEWKLKELQRKESFERLVDSLTQGSDQDHHAAYIELRDKVIRRRDIPELIKQVDRSVSPEVKTRLQNLISLVNGESRLPNGGWTRNSYESNKAYEKEFERLGLRSILSFERSRPAPSLVLTLTLFNFPAREDNLSDAVGLILDLEPKALELWNEWKDVSFVSILSDLEVLKLIFTSVSDLTPLKSLTKLKELDITFAPVNNLEPLNMLPSLNVLKLKGTKVTNLSPLAKLTSLAELHIDSAETIDLRPLEGIPDLKVFRISECTKAETNDAK